MAALLALATPAAWAAHGYVLWGELKYPAGFEHFDYVNADAPKGGEIRLVGNSRASAFDKFNPFTMKGSAPTYLTDLMFDTLLTGSLDELGSGYGLLAEDVQVAADGLSATFTIRPQARFHNGDPVRAEDVKYTFDTLVGPYVIPGYRTILIDVEGVDVLAERSVRFRFVQPNRELPLVVGGLPIFSHKWGEGKPFDEVVTDVPIGSGPYRIDTVKFGKDITFVRDPDYWARDLNVKRGVNNFDRVQIKIYRDNTARLEALKAGEFDLMAFYSAGDWARRVDGRKFRTGELVKGEFPHKLPTGFQSYVLNTRRPFLQDRRVREALGLAIDFQWMNRQMFYNAYRRVRGIFGNTPCESHGRPGPRELALMEPLRQWIPPEAFGPAFEPPRTDRPADPAVGGLRENLRKARDLLEEAGWTVRDGALKNAAGQPLVLEYLDSSEGGVRVVSAWMRNLDKLGITLRYHAVDFALYQQRLQTFDFDVTTIAFPGTPNPGQEYADLFGSEAADTDDSSNLAGVKNPAVDTLIADMVSAKTEPEYRAACRALERVIAWGYYMLPQWYNPVHRLAYNAWRLRKPQTVPPYFQGESWAMETWWASASQR
ncbi:MAG: extracellular solute-binding protein [Ottowia sp.]|nr:extracellular solute-binding protein [Ottowia sp.]